MRGNKETTVDYIVKGAMEILKGLGYNLERNINEQFLERHKDKLANAQKIKKGRPRKNTQSK